MSKEKPIPNGATHHWTAALPIYHGGIVENQLSFYKKVNDEWWVYSNITGWRVSQNPPEWFEEETRLGYFQEIE